MTNSDVLFSTCPSIRKFNHSVIDAYSDSIQRTKPRVNIAVGTDFLCWGGISLHCEKCPLYNLSSFHLFMYTGGRSEGAREKQAFVRFILTCRTMSTSGLVTSTLWWWSSFEPMMHFIARQLPAGYWLQTKKTVCFGYPINIEYILLFSFLANHPCAPQSSSISSRSNTTFTAASTRKYCLQEIFPPFLNCQ